METLRRALDDIADHGYSRSLRIGLAVLALLLNIGFYLPKVPGGGELGVGAFAHADKVFHALVFAFTVWTVGRLLAPVRRFPIGWVVLAAIFNALFSEAFQGLFLPSRSADFFDLVADSLGIALGAAAWRYEQLRAGLQNQNEEIN
ncbi:VanZ family protein [Dermabacteraceae bacterium P13101]|nr:VanZ family protein [Dermabacteraceae bacterium TAE3-ERU5]